MAEGCKLKRGGAFARHAPSLLYASLSHVMLKGMANPLTTTKPKRRWLQFSMRTALLLVTLLCVGLSLWIAPAERRRRAVLAIEALRGRFDYASDEAASDSFLVTHLRQWLPQAYFDEVKSVDLKHTYVTDAELEHLKGLTGLRRLWLEATQITDDGLVHLEGLTRLQVLSLACTQITDGGLAHLEGLTALKELDLRGDTQVRDDGLAHLEGLTSLQTLWLDDTQITDDGLVHLEGLAGLRYIGLSNTQVTDTGLAHLQGLTNLRQLFLGSTQVTDVGLAHLERLTGLHMLDLYNTQITDVGLSKLHNSMPTCVISGP